MCVLLVQGGVRAEPPVHAEWEMTFQDEFDGESVDWAVWQSQAGIRGTEKPEGRWPENNVVKDGVLYQITKKEIPTRGGKEWSTAHMWTRTFAQKYGYFEARLRYGRHLNNAFWLYRPRGARFADPPHFEIDVNEGHTPREVAMTLHYYFYLEGETTRELFSTGKRWEALVDLDQDFHLYGTEWNEREIIWYVDGKPLRRVQNPVCHAPVDVRLSTVIMTGALQKAGLSIDTMAGVSMATDWVRIYRKTKDLVEPQLPEMEVCKVPTVEKLKQQVAPATQRTVILKEDFEAAELAALPIGWEVGDQTPSVVTAALEARRENNSSGRKMLQLKPQDYAFIMLDEAVAGRAEVEFDYRTPPRADGLLFVTLGNFDKHDDEARKTSYYTGDIGPYIHWRRVFIDYYTEQDKWTHFARWGQGKWARARVVLDIPAGVFDYYAGEGAADFQSGGVFRQRQKEVRGIGFRHRGQRGSVYIDNVTVRVLAD